MGFRDLSKWFRVGLILSGIYLASVLVLYLFYYLEVIDGFGPFVFLMLPSVVFPFISDCLFSGFGSDPVNCNSNLIYLTALVINLIFYFLVGAFIGKLKSKKESNQKSGASKPL